MCGLMESCMMDNGLRGKNMDLVFGKVLRVIVTWGNGKMEVLMGMEFMFGLMEIDMKDNLRII